MLFLIKTIKKLHPQKVSGAALQLVIAVALIITVISGCLILLTYYSTGRYLKYNRAEKMQLHLENAITLSLSKTFNIQDTILTGNIFGADSVQFKQEDWGIFKLMNIAVTHQTDTLSKTYLIGRTLKSINEVLFVVDEDRPLSISGDSKVTGDAYLPKAGIRSAYVEGKYYDKNKPLIYGKQLTSERKLPALNNYENLFKSIAQLKNKGSNKLSEKLNQSFFNEAKVVSDKVIKIENAYTGKIIFIADSLITVSENASLENVILYAPVVQFLKGNKSTVQVFARDSVILEEGVKLSYPSAICMFREAAKKDEFSKIILTANTNFEGIIIARGADSNYLKYILQTAKNCSLKGWIDIDGTFNYTSPAAYDATIYAKRMVCQLKGLLYENYLIDLKLNAKERPVSFLTTNILNTNGNKQVLKWLN